MENKRSNSTYRCHAKHCDEGIVLQEDGKSLLLFLDPVFILHIIDILSLIVFKDFLELFIHPSSNRCSFCDEVRREFTDSCTTTPKERFKEDCPIDGKETNRDLAIRHNITPCKVIEIPT